MQINRRRGCSRQLSIEIKFFSRHFVGKTSVAKLNDRAAHDQHASHKLLSSTTRVALETNPTFAARKTKDATDSKELKWDQIQHRNTKGDKSLVFLVRLPHCEGKRTRQKPMLEKCSRRLVCWNCALVWGRYWANAKSNRDKCCTSCRRRALNRPRCGTSSSTFTEKDAKNQTPAVHRPRRSRLSLTVATRKFRLRQWRAKHHLWIFHM